MPYSPLWPRYFAAERDRLVATLKGVNYSSIEHAGSTSVPGLAAKPNIDIDIVVPTREAVMPCVDALVSRGGWFSRGEMGIPDRHMMRSWPKGAEPVAVPPLVPSIDDQPLDTSALPRINLYVVVEGSLALRNHLALREVLRRDEHLREKYAAIKWESAAKYPDNLDAYTISKSSILKEVLSQGGLGESEVQEIFDVNQQ